MKHQRQWLSTLKNHVPIVQWLPQYAVRQHLKFDVVAGITVAMMLIPQEVSLSSIMHVPPHHGLYTAATSPLIYAIFGSSTVLSVASGSEVSLLVGSILHPIENEQERIATGILLSFLSGVILLVVRLLGLSQLADFFSRPVMGGFISAGGFLIMLSQVPNWLSIKIQHAPYPPQTVYKILAQVDKTEVNGFVVGLMSIALLFALKWIKRRFFPNPVLSDLFDAPVPLKEELDLVILTPVPAHAHAPPPHHSHGFSLTDEQYLSMEVAARAQQEQQYTALETSNAIIKQPTKSKSKLLLYFGARTLCDLGPLLVCIVGGIVGFVLGPKRIKVTGDVPGGFPAPMVPWYGLSDGLIPTDKLSNILLNALTIATVVYLSSIAMSKRLAIQRGEDIVVEQELMGLGIASVVCGWFQAMPPTGGMSRTAVNIQNARTQLASICTTLIIIVALYTLTGTLYYLPKATLASIIIAAGYSLVEFREAKWLFRVKRDEFYVWLASFVLTLGLGVVQGLLASIVSSMIALMIKTKRPPVAILGQLPETGALVDRALYPQAQITDHVIVVRVESSLYFANCERVAVAIEQEIRLRSDQAHVLVGVILDACHMNDMDATTIQVLSDLQEKLAVRQLQLAIANANGRLHDMLASTTLIKRLVAQNPTIRLDDAMQQMTQRPSV